MMLLNMMILVIHTIYKMIKSTFFKLLHYSRKIYYFVFRLVVFRKSNKAVIKLTVTPDKDLKLGDEVISGFTMQHLYTNTITSQKYDHRLNVFLTLGTLVGSDQWN